MHVCEPLETPEPSPIAVILLPGLTYKFISFEHPPHPYFRSDIRRYMLAEGVLATTFEVAPQLSNRCRFRVLAPALSLRFPSFRHQPAEALAVRP